VLFKKGLVGGPVLVGVPTLSPAMSGSLSVRASNELPKVCTVQCWEIQRASRLQVSFCYSVLLLMPVQSVDWNDLQNDLLCVKWDLVSCIVFVGRLLCSDAFW